MMDIELRRLLLGAIPQVLETTAFLAAVIIVEGISYCYRFSS
jgi:hypothetical protein